MTAREKPASIGSRRGQGQLANALAEFHEARLLASISQDQVARAMGKSRQWLGWTEAGNNHGLSVVDLAVMLACVGLELSVRGFPARGGLRDVAHLRLLERFHQLLGTLWSWRTEVAIPVAGDLRAWDAAIGNPNCRIGVDAETRLRDVQAVDRRVMLKLRDSGLDRAILLLAPTLANRQALREHGPLLAANYPVGTRAALAALRAGRDPGGNAIIVLPPQRRVAGSPPAGATPVGLA